jgi:hypothetical protein
VSRHADKKCANLFFSIRVIRSDNRLTYIAVVSEVVCRITIKVNILQSNTTVYYSKLSATYFGL